MEVESEAGDAQNGEDPEEILRQYDIEPDITPDGDLNISLGNRDQVPVTEDCETLDLGAIRSKTRYGLTEKPVRKRYFCTTLLEGNNDNITNLREPPVVKSKRMSDRIIDEKKHARKT